MNELNAIQKIALEGEIAYIISTSNHTAEIIFRIYSTLKGLDEKYQKYTFDCFKRLTNLPETTYFMLQAELGVDKTPVWIWVNKCIEDLKMCLSISESSSEGNVICADKKELKKKIIKSAFMMFCKNCMIEAVSPVRDLCLKIMEDNLLSFLHEACFILLTEIRELEETEDNKELCSPEKGIKKVFMQAFDIRNFLSFQMEMSFTEEMDKLIEDTKKSKQINKTTNKTTNKSITVRNKNSKTFYAVKKTFNESGISNTLQCFKSKKDAEQFITEIYANFPDLKNFCTLSIVELAD